MIGLVLLMVPLALLLAWFRHRRAAKLEVTPLGGLDTGCRSPFRTPARFLAPRKGF